MTTPTVPPPGIILPNLMAPPGIGLMQPPPGMLGPLGMPVTISPQQQQQQTQQQAPGGAPPSNGDETGATPMVTTTSSGASEGGASASSGSAAAAAPGEGGEKKPADIPPNNTVYVNNLNERVKLDVVKKELKELFQPFGEILDVVAITSAKMRGQAFVVFREINSATEAIAKLQGHSFHSRPIRLAYCKSKSDAIAKMDGTFVPRPKVVRVKPEKRPPGGEAGAPKKPSAKRSDSGKNKIASNTTTRSSNNVPNKILFVENLPPNCAENMLVLLFNNFPGFKEVRLVPTKEGIAFVEYENEILAGVALHQLNNYKLTPENSMVITFAKR
ncbi:U2 small nuclear ribonucleoprotein B'' [Pelomyxa schiedti]|nr:U2 small nuclear ribonucleoprotein B'' [Pelomyxa schiedti]